MARLDVLVRAIAARHLDRGALVLPRVLGDERDDAVRRVGAVERRARTDEHLDARQVDLGYRRELPHGEPVLRQHRDAPVLHHQHAVVEGRVEAARVDGDARDPHLNEVEPLHFLERARPRRADGVVEHVGADRRDRRRRLGDPFCLTRGGRRDAAELHRRALEGDGDPRHLPVRHLDVGDGSLAVAEHPHVDVVRPRRNAGDREPAELVRERRVARRADADLCAVDGSLRLVGHRAADSPGLRARRRGEHHQHGRHQDADQAR